MTSQLSDQELLHRYEQEGNNEWLGVLLGRYTHLLFGVCMKYLKQEERARDAVQQIYLKVLHELPRYRITYFKAWLYRVARNHCLMQLRPSVQNRSQPLPEQMEMEDEQQSRQRLMEKEHLLTLLQAAVTRLAPEQQNCIRLFYLQKRSYQEISAHTGYSLMQVKSFIQNGKRNLKKMIEQMRDRPDDAPAAG
ncbi:sigma-70 family RNA polymerase sigma factor [Compostibacter hankyongensis]|uniref:Sigma-70 family RNA polymerase sigma factor n=1 Tax=Compostibacter hankyongensis TaxID=1007089 RepID=A0ABP8FQF9_9BACT